MKTKLITFLIGLAAVLSASAQDFKLPTAEPVDVITVTTQRVQSAELTLRVFTVRPDLGVIVGHADYGPGTKAYPITITNAALAKQLTAALVKEVKPQVETAVNAVIQKKKEREAREKEVAANRKAREAIEADLRAKVTARREQIKRERAAGTNAVAKPNP